MSRRRKPRRRQGGRPAGAASPPAPRAAAVRANGRESREVPRPPWHPFPLVELCVLLGLVLIAVGALSASSARGRALLVGGLVLGSLGGLDTAVREHWAGRRSHAAVLAGLPAILAAVALTLAHPPWPVVVLAAAAVFAVALAALRRRFERAR
jgi:lysylphosphatidylglycerol synthetase-like protein (DUF2156 family)